jgi:hypothetical protein
MRVAAQNETKHGREHKQEREDREEPVVGDGCGQVAALVVPVLLPDSEGKPEQPMPLLESIKPTVEPAKAHRFLRP